MENVIIDGNYLLNKSVFALHKVKELDKLKQSLHYTLKNLMSDTAYTNFVFASDYGSSWRKGVFPEYKANRKEKTDKDDINWKIVYEMYEEFKHELNTETPAHVLQEKGAEGDDVISQFVRRSNLKGYSNTIIASDRDLLQLVNYSYDPDFINIMVNEEFKNRKIYIPLGGEEFLDELRKRNNKNVFFMSSDNSHFIRYVDEQMAKREILEVFSEEKTFLKIVAGDGKDNVASTHYKHNLEKGTKRGIGEGTAAKIYARYKELHPEPINFKSKDFILRAKNAIIENRKIAEEEVAKQVQESLVLNTKLIMLDEAFIPKELRTDLNSKIDAII
jgi:5'-3' exonuclease